MNNEKIMKAAETLMSMCCDFRMGGITQKTFVSNLELFSRECRATHNAETPAIPQQPQGEICCAGCKNLMDSGERDCGMDFPPCYKRKLSPVR